jgi:hypothetical protein
VDAALGRALAFEDWVYGIFNPYNVVSDVVGLVVLAAFAWRYRLFRPSRLWAWARTGKLGEPGAQ